MASTSKRVLVVGGSGYLGQHVLDAFGKERRKRNGGGDLPPWDLAFTYHRSVPPPELLAALSPVRSFRLDLKSGEGFGAIYSAFGQPHVVVNCAAISVPRVCEVDAMAAMDINVPSSLVNWLSSFTGQPTLLIHLSTDQVYEGVKSFYKEDDETAPVNMYGKSKVAAEQFVKTNYSNFAILRSSIIYGPQSISPVEKSLPIQWIDAALSGDHEVEFFFDEFRCPIYVCDVVNIILLLVRKSIEDGKQMQLLLNVGGPNRVSRLQMAEIIATVRNHKKSLIKSVSSSSVNRGVVSPLDISMDISKLFEALGFTPVTFEDGVSLTFQKN